jgi:D-amino-acid dehydrogenase
MRIVVMGSGVIGTSCAYFLARAGHEVTVIDRQAGAGLETSYANAGEVSPGYSSPWAGPGVPVKAIKWLLMHHSPLVIRALADPSMWRFALMMLANCTEARYRINKSRMVPVAEYSRDVLRTLRAETGLGYDERAQGTLQLFRTCKQLDSIANDVAILREYGVPFEVLDRAGFIRAEPALARTQQKFVGALRLPNDETGDCHLFTQRLAALAQSIGATFRYGVAIEAIAREGGRIGAVLTSQGRIEADHYLCALGSHTPLLVRPLGIDLPVYPVKGYSITVPVTDASGAPESTVMDETHKVAVTRLGDRIRAGGTAELAGYDLTPRAARKDTLTHVVRDLFPDGGDVSQASFWCGLRPMTPDGPPVLGPTPYPNLTLATGHGTLGWTMAAGTGRVIADLLSGRKPDVPLDGLTLARYA